MASMGTRSVQRQLWVTTTEVSESPGQPFYQRLNRLLGNRGFDGYVEAQYERFYVGHRQQGL